MQQLKTDLSQYSKTLDTKSSRLKTILWYFCNILFIRNRWNVFVGFKLALLRLFGAKVGKQVVIKPGVNIKFPWLLQIGDNSWIGEGVWIDNLTQVTIGSNCVLSQGAMLLTGNHNYKKTTFDLINKPINIEDGAWIGAQSVVCPGITVQTHAILTVSSVAVRNLEAYTIYMGNPAVKIRKRGIVS